MRRAKTHPLRPSVSPSLCLSVSLSLCLSFATAQLAAQDEPEQDESPYRPGLVANYAAPSGESAARIDETLAMDWQAATPDPRLPAGKFSATWTGRLWTQVAGRHRLAVYVGGGTISVALAGRKVIEGEAAEPKWFVSEPLGLEFDRHPLQVTFEKTGQQARLSLYWSGPSFVLEPVPERFLMHDRQASPQTDFERGRRLAAALRCGACHADESAREELPAPALDRLSGHINPAWLVDWLAREGEAPAEPRLTRRMPHFGLTPVEAANIAAWLVRLPAEKLPALAETEEIEQKGAKSAKKKKEEGEREKPSIADGERLFLTLGCLACHQHGELGESGLFGGGDLTQIAAKRPPEFFARWLVDPASLNRHHRMPVFELSADERASLALFLAVGNALRGIPGTAEQRSDAAAGEKLVTQFRCAACHALPGVEASPLPANLKRLAAASDWSRSCASQPDVKANRPGYRLSQADQAALKTYFVSVRPAASQAPQAAGRDLLVELNCLACHAREGIDRTTNALPARLQDKLAAVAALHDDLGKQVPAMTPPALNSVGDKLHDAALSAAILRKDKPHRPYLLVRMPKYKLTDEQLGELAAYFTVTDRIPNREGEARVEPHSPRPMVGALTAAGPRLVTTNGFGCTSCHDLGGVPADKAPLNARGPDLSMLEKRIRREWFNRWCNNPARIVPRMEMPSVQVPVRGVLNEQIDDQLAAVWHILNTPGFVPPEPNPVRVLRLSGVPERKERPIVIHDVVKDGDKTYLFPLVIGLPNRHNVLFDLETNRLAAWWLGDTARQRTKGKSWYWEQGAEALFTSRSSNSELTLLIDGKALAPASDAQFAATLDHVATAARLDFLAPLFVSHLRFTLPSSSGTKPIAMRVAQRFETLEPDDSKATGFRRTIVFFEAGPSGARQRLRLLDEETAATGRWDSKAQTFTTNSGDISLRVEKPIGVVWESAGALVCAIDTAKASANSVVIAYTTRLPVDRYVVDPLSPLRVEASPVDIGTGFVARRLPLADDLMPSGFAWKPDGRLAFTTLKGQVFVAHDSNFDELEDTLSHVADGLPTPYGLAAQADRLDVITKGGLLRLEGRGPSGWWAKVIATGWGVTDDYHDWAVGLVPGENGEFFIGVPCQQDQRSEAAAKHRGQLLKLVPRTATAADSREYDIEVISSGHRFPMGLARNRDGELFVTDNQGNYNPFNELNHVRKGAHFGFINELEKQKGFRPPPLARPAIDIPHPWTRSVNGICFLDTPPQLRAGLPLAERADHFGPLEGHLIGCEYDTRQLIRMTLQKVGDTYQGAAYPLSIPPERVEDGLLGPIVCAVSPRGELYVGNIRDSGWGAGNNVGDIVQIKIEPDKLPCGIAEVRATADGFVFDFFRPVDRAKAADAANYSIASYRRESTPAYGGPNLDRRIETIAAIELSPDAKRVTLKLKALREGFLYEFQLKPLVRGKEPFHPAEAHYTLNRIPAR